MPSTVPLLPHAQAWSTLVARGPEYWELGWQMGKNRDWGQGRGEEEFVKCSGRPCPNTRLEGAHLTCLTAKHRKADVSFHWPLTVRGGHSFFFLIILTNFFLFPFANLGVQTALGIHCPGSASSPLPHNERQTISSNLQVCLPVLWETVRRCPSPPEPLGIQVLNLVLSPAATYAFRIPSPVRSHG